MEKSSRTLATNMRKLADWLDSKPEFPVSEVQADAPYQNFYGDKDSFLAAVRAIGSGTKSTGIIDRYLRFTASTTPEGTKFELEASRDGLCRLVKPAQEAVYECEPLLSPEEDAVLGGE